MGKFDLSSLELNEEVYKELHWEGEFSDYIEIVRNNPLVAASAFKRLYEAIIGYGVEEYTDFKKKVIVYKGFSDPKIALELRDVGVSEDDTVFGVDLPIMKFMKSLESAAKEFGPHKRLFLLVGPVGCAKSTIVRRMKKILEKFTRTQKGAVYTVKWSADGNAEVQKVLGAETATCPIHEEPLNLVPSEKQPSLLSYLNNGDGHKVNIRALPCPFCKCVLQKGLELYKGKWVELVQNHLRVQRFVFSEHDRIGIGTFQPKDEKNQDSTELTGDINYRALSRYGVDSDPRAFSFDGEFFTANRGLIEFIEILKLDVAFLYDLLTGSQEHKVKPKKFQQVDIDEVIIGHTNIPEYNKLQQNEFMEALKDRTIKFSVPYVIKLKQEEKIYRKRFGAEMLKRIGKHMAPHTIEMAAMWGVLTRLLPPDKANLTLLQKLKLYDGQSLPGMTEDNVKELLKAGTSQGEGTKGISPRYIEDKISNALVDPEATDCINPFKVISELEGGLASHALIVSKDEKAKYEEQIKAVIQEFEAVVKEEVQRAVSSDESGLKKLFDNYVQNVKACTSRQKIKNKYTGKDEDPDERLMRSVEERIDIPESRKDDFRREIMNYIGSLALEGKPLDHKSNERLLRALELKLFEDRKDTIQRFTTVLTSGTEIPEDTQKELDAVTSKLIRDYGYCKICANDVLSFVASIFARGDLKEKEKKK